MDEDLVGAWLSRARILFAWQMILPMWPRSCCQKSFLTTTKKQQLVIIMFDSPTPDIKYSQGPLLETNNNYWGAGGVEY